MVNVRVYRVKDILKYLVVSIITIIVLINATRYFNFAKNNKENLQDSVKINIKKISIGVDFLKKCIKTIIPIMAINTECEDNYNKKSDEKYVEKIIGKEIKSIKQVSSLVEETKIEENENVENNKENENVVSKSEQEEDEINEQLKNEEIEKIISQSNIKTEIVTKNPISENYNVKYGDVKIKNETTYNLTEEIMNPSILIENKNILIFHTHTCESYTSSEKYSYTATGNFRTTDLKYTVAGVGDEFEKYLNLYNINVMHDKTYHDYPAYSGSYTRSLETVENRLKEKSADIIIDLHRDAIGSREDYAPTVKIGEDYAAQLMFVIGTNEGGLWHPNWNNNFKFAIKVQQTAEKMYPGLFKPIMLTKSRYNQHVGKYASIIEVGATGNTLEQCLTSMKYLSIVINEVLN